MGFLGYLLHPWSFILTGLAIIHFIRRRPDTYWLWIILLLFPPVGAIIYLFAEALPDLGLLRGTLKVFPRRKRIRELEVLVRENPSTGNWEELGDLYMEDGKLAQARTAFDKAIGARASTLDPFYRRGVCAILSNDAAAAQPDLEKVVAKEPRYDFDRAAGLLAHAYAQTGEKDKAGRLFAEVTARSTSSETYLNYADLLASEGRNGEAREWAQRVLDKRPAIPGYQRRLQRPWFRRARKILKQLPA